MWVLKVFEYGMFVPGFWSICVEGVWIYGINDRIWVLLDCRGCLDVETCIIVNLNMKCLDTRWILENFYMVCLLWYLSEESVWMFEVGCMLVLGGCCRECLRDISIDWDVLMRCLVHYSW